MPIDEYRTMNLANWEDRTQVGLGSTMYDPTAFIADPTRVSRIVTYDVDRLRPHLGAGGVSGRRLLHLQCHIGLDTLSWARLGAEGHGPGLLPVRCRRGPEHQYREWNAGAVRGSGTVRRSTGAAGAVRHHLHRCRCARVAS